MKEPLWLELNDVLSFHEEMLVMHGGLAGVRDMGLLESALGRPRQLFHYGKPTLFELGASYAAGIVKNHPFLDGNKRAGFMAAALFLESNGLTFAATEPDVVAHTLALASGEIDERIYAAFLRASCPAKRRPARRKAR